MIERPEPGPILIGFGEAPALAEAARCLSDAGHTVVAFRRAGRRGSRARPQLRGIRSVRITAPEDDAAGAVASLLEVAAAIRPAAVMPLDDAAVWLVGAAAADLDAQVIGPTGPLVGLALDRRVQLTGAELAGLEVPPTVTCRTRGDLLAAAGRSLVVRPALCVYEHAGRLVRPVSRRCAADADLERLAARWDERVPVLAQERVDGQLEEVTGIVTRAGFEQWSIDLRERVAPDDEFGMHDCITLPPDVEALDRCEALLAEAHWRGPFSIAFVRDADERLWFIGLAGGWSPNGVDGHPAEVVADALGLAADEV